MPSIASLVNQPYTTRGILLLSAAVCVFMSFQYVSQTTFPMGGDAVRYVVRAQRTRELSAQSIPETIKYLRKSSAYPATIALLAITKIPAISWPDFFVWWMAIAHSLVGLSLLLLLYRLHGWQAASTGILLWSMTATVNHHYVNGIFAHLLSLSFLLLYFHQFTQKKMLGMIVAALAAASFHFMTGLVLLIVTYMYSLTYTPLAFSSASKKQKQRAAIFAIVLVILGALGTHLFINRKLFHAELPVDKHSVPVLLLTRTPLAPFMPITIAGLGTLVINLAKRRKEYTLLFYFALVSILLTFNNLLEVSLQVRRFESYYLLTLIILISLGTPFLLKSLKKGVQTYGALVLLIVLFALQLGAAWQRDTQVYAHYESPNYARIHPDELATIDWIGKNLSSHDLILSTRANRHTEWIGILTDIPWRGLPDTNEVFEADGQQLKEIINTNGYTHVVLLKRREDPRSTFHGSPDVYPIIFENEGAVIMKLN